MSLNLSFLNQGLELLGFGERACNIIENQFDLMMCQRVSMCSINLYAQSPDTSGHTKAFNYPVMDHWGKRSKCSGTRQSRTANLSVHSRTRQPPDHDDRPKAEGPQIGRIHPPSSTGGILPIWGIVCHNSPATGRPSPGGLLPVFVERTAQWQIKKTMVFVCF